MVTGLSGSSEGETLPVSTSTEAVRIVEKFLADFGMIEKMPKPPINPPIPAVPVTFVEEILSRFLAEVLSSTDSTSPTSRRHLSRSKVNEIVEDLKEAMEQGLSKHKISLVAATNEQHLPPEREDAVNEVLLSISRNMIQKSGSQQELYDDITGFDLFFPQEMATIIIEELCDCDFLQAVSDSPATRSQSAMNPGRIANMVLSQVSVRPEELETLASGASQNEDRSPISEYMDVDTAAAPKKGSAFFMKIPNTLSRLRSFFSSCLPLRGNLRKVAPEITPRR
ncbi:uncharacterized protein LOC132249872 [Alligator mississippiensis]|uniref:uncharacterized protein LOC132249872 n=1 Tax=Alligator mississippiensis TaxID=8496 RepID=UPI002877F461|nr:uncharacterized protein LOC132249872 [Alligator mississippiensis]